MAKKSWFCVFFMVLVSVSFFVTGCNQSEQSMKTAKDCDFESIKIVIVGDSTVATLPLEQEKRGWGQMIGGFFADNVQIINLAKSGKSSWAQKDIQGAKQGIYLYNPETDLRGPVTVAVVGEMKIRIEEDANEDNNIPLGTIQKKELESAGREQSPTAGKIVVLGDSDFLLSEYLTLLGNQEFLLRTVRWMLEEEHLLVLEKEPATQEQLMAIFVDSDRAKMIFSIVVVLEPALVLAVGLVVFRHRRQKV